MKKLICFLIALSSLAAFADSYKIVSGRYASVDGQRCEIQMDKNGSQIVITFADLAPNSQYPKGRPCPTPYTSFASLVSPNLYTGKDQGGTYQIIILQSSNIMMRVLDENTWSNWFAYTNTVACK